MIYKYPMFYVGGVVRNFYIQRNIETKPSSRLVFRKSDVDFAIEAPDYASMTDFLTNDLDVRIVKEDSDFGRCLGKIHISKLNNTTVLGDLANNDYLYCDFVITRSDISPSGRKPKSIKPATIEEDLSRRDFTMNAIAIDVATGYNVDPFRGVEDIRKQIIRFVGNPAARISEDYLRVLRAYRFCCCLSQITLYPWAISKADLDVIRESAEFVAHGIAQHVSDCRVMDELNKMFSCDNVTAIKILEKVPTCILESMLRNIKLKASAIS